MPSVRRIRRGDGAKLGATRLRALLTDPEAFGSTHEHEATRTPEQWEMRAATAAEGDTQFLAVAESDGEFVGMVGAYQPDDRPTTRELYGMWVAREFRSSGIGSELVDAVTEWSTQTGADEIALWVVVENRQAHRLYLKAGFVETGLTQPLPSNHSLTEIRMSMALPGN